MLTGDFAAGQNLGKGFGSWSDCIAAWYNEKKDFIYNGTVTFAKVGHYTQVRNYAISFPHVLRSGNAWTKLELVQEIYIYL